MDCRCATSAPGSPIQASFLSDVQGVLGKQQNTATLGLVRCGGVKGFEICHWRLLCKTPIWIAITIAFFALSIAYVHFCEHVK